MRHKVLLVDEQKMFIQVLASFLTRSYQHVVTYLTTTTIGGIDQCKNEQPDLLILNPELHGQDGLAVGRQLIVSNPKGKIIILKNRPIFFAPPADLEPWIKGIFDKTQDATLLEKQIRLLIEAKAKVTQTPRSGSNNFGQLTKREREIFALVGEGLPNRDISRKLGVSEHTIKTHRKRIANKLNLRGAALIRTATLAAPPHPGR
ncbi:DNA-binding response regulator [bacterium]|nr:DNA-binding response regulator [Verrucomicrobiota bacterium]NBS55297.1 DNA-binding response regulator [bacterium]